MTLGALAGALGRVPMGSVLRFALPWRLSPPDPHDLHDPMAAFFGSAVFDTLYRPGNALPFPSLARTLPTRHPGGRLSFSLRPDLRLSNGAPLLPRDVARSLERSRLGSAAGLLAPFAPFTARTNRDAPIETRGGDPESLAAALASTACAIAVVGRERKLLGTGAFAVSSRGRGIQLVGNAHAARGLPYLERITIEPSGDLATPLRLFESGDVDLGWLGAGLHRRRPGAVEILGPPMGWVVLRTGRLAKTWAAPGVARGLAHGVSATRLRVLGLTVSDDRPDAAAYRGPSGELLVLEGSPQLLELARAVSSSLSSPGHTLDVRAVPPAELEARRRDEDHLMMLDWVTRIGETPREDALALLGAVSPRLARRPPRAGTSSTDDLTRGLPLGVLGTLRIRGALAPNVRGLRAWDLAEAWILPEKP
jgi:hypothetical protein